MKLASLPLVLAMLALSVSGCNQQDRYDVVVLQSRVKQLEAQLESLQQEVGKSAERAKLQKTVDRLQEEVIQLQRALNDVGTLMTANVRPEETLPAEPTPEEIEAAIVSLESAGVSVEKDDQGKVVAVRATEFPVELSVIEQLTKFSAIKQVAVSGPWVTHEMFDVFGKLKTLERLDAEVTIADQKALEKLAGLSNLKFVQLFRTDIDDDCMKILAAMPALEQIRCGQTRIGDAGLAHLANLESLRAIDLSDCNRVTGEGVAHLSRLPNLKFLKVWGPQIDDNSMDSIALMTSLEVLGLNDTQVTDSGIEKLDQLEKLKEVHLVRTRTGDRSLAILSRMPDIHTLRLRDTEITDVGLESLTSLKNLRKLDLSENNSPGITDACVGSLAKIESLEELNLWTTSITDEGVKSLTGMANLKWLNLDKTEITDAACKELSAMTQLTWLHLGSNEITDASVPSLVKLLNLKYLNISHTGISQDGFFQLDDEFAPLGGIVIPP